MDDWTHPIHGPDNNSVSNDSEIKPPLGLRWLGGVAKNVNGTGGGSSTRALVVCGPRAFTLGGNEIENLGVLPDRPSGERFLTARDAFNGMPLWTLDCGIADGDTILWTNAFPLATNGELVYTAAKDKLIAVDAASGKIVFEAPTKFQIYRLVLLDGVVVTGNWDAATHPKNDFTFVPKTGNGSIDAFDAKTGKPLWSAPVAPFLLLAANKTVYAQIQEGAERENLRIAGFDLHSGKELWTRKDSEFGENVKLTLDVAGPDFVVMQCSSETTVVLAAADGRTLWERKFKGNWSPMIDGLLWNAGNKCDPLTGESKGRLPTWLSGRGCQISTILGDQFVLSNYGMRSFSGKAPVAFPNGGVRMPCIQGMTPANGLLYLPQNNCRCAPGSLFGMLALGTSSEPPPPADFEKPRPVEKGPAFGDAPAGKSAGWPAYRHDSQRSNATSGQVPLEGVKELWSTLVVKPSTGELARSYAERLAPCISAPICAEGLTFIAAVDNNQLLAFDPNGKQVWSAALPARMETPPTYQGGFLIGGCNDGCVYAWRAHDGTLVWRTRAAPEDRRIVAYGQLESLWPAQSSVLVHENTVYVSAGRSSNIEGGVAIVALNLSNGETKWSRCIGHDALRLNDMLSLRDGQIAWHHLRFEPQSGKLVNPLPLPTSKDYGGGAGKFEGMLTDCLWTVLKNRRSCNAYELGEAFKLNQGESITLAWNESIVARSSGVYSRENKELWSLPAIKGRLIQNIVVCGNAVLYGGRICDATTKKVSGFLWVASLYDGKKLADFPLPSPPILDGIAVSDGRIHVSLWDGSLRCFGAN
jgi:outer membrane protein assembly factor BamB